MRVFIAGFLLATATTHASAQQSENTKSDKPNATKTVDTKEALKPRKDGLIPVNPNHTVLIDQKEKRVLLKTTVCNRDALLEMLICLPERKLHESILVLDAEAIHVHTALKAIGAKEGSPAKYTPKYVPSHGQPLDIFVNWKDKDGKEKRCRAQDWIRYSVRKYHVEKLDVLPSTVKVRTKPALELRYDTRRKELLWFGPMTDAEKKQLYSLSEDKAYRAAIDKLRESATIRPMDASFLFAGSFFYEDEDHPRFYTAEGGFVACVANLPEALIDVNIPSSGSNADLSFETQTDRIPPEDTEVTVELIPLAPKPKAKATKKTPSKTGPSSDGTTPSGSKTPPDK